MAFFYGSFLAFGKGGKVMTWKRSIYELVMFTIFSWVLLSLTPWNSWQYWVIALCAALFTHWGHERWACPKSSKCGVREAEMLKMYTDLSGIALDTCRLILQAHNEDPSIPARKLAAIAQEGGARVCKLLGLPATLQELQEEGES